MCGHGVVLVVNKAAARGFLNGCLKPFASLSQRWLGLRNPFDLFMLLAALFHLLMAQHWRGGPTRH
jgi:hypothetical protein